MRWPTLLLLGTILLHGPWLTARGEEIKYYVWTDDQGVIHAADTPPLHHKYETRTINVETNVAPSAPSGRASGRAGTSTGNEAGQPPAPATGVTSEPSTTGAELPIAEQEQQRLKRQPGFNAGGAPTAPGGKTAAPGTTAPGAATAPGAPGAQGAATAPGATIPPAVMGP